LFGIIETPVRLKSHLQFLGETPVRLKSHRVWDAFYFI
jgi:hypothetical protein